MEVLPDKEKAALTGHRQHADDAKSKGPSISIHSRKETMRKAAKIRTFNKVRGL